jgi:hypothetical protein
MLDYVYPHLILDNAPDHRPYLGMKYSFLEKSYKKSYIIT